MPKLKKFIVITCAKVATGYTVKAKSKKDAEARFWEGNFEDSKELSDYEVDSEEHILEVKNANI